MEGHYNDVAEESHRRESIAMAQQWADEEQRRRLQEAYYDELEAREEQEERRQLAAELIEQERQERIEAYNQGHDEPKRQQARRASLQIIHDAFGWNNVDHRDDLNGMHEDEALAQIEEEREREYRKRLANQMILEEQQRRIQEQWDEEEYERSLHQEHAQHLWEQEKERAVQEHEEHGHHKQRAARRASLSFIMEAGGDLFQKNWLKRNCEHISDDDDAPATEDMFLREQEEHARAEALHHAEAEYEQRLARAEAIQAGDDEQQRRIDEAIDYRNHHNPLLQDISQATAKQARRRSIANVPSFAVDLEEDFDDYKDWAESVIHEQSEDLEQLNRAVASLSQQLAEANAALEHRTEQLGQSEEALYHAYGDLNTLQQANSEATSIANNNAEAAYEREEQLQIAMQEIAKLQDTRGQETDMMDEMLGQFERLRTHDHDLEERVEKTEAMLEDALLQLQKSRRDNKKEKARRQKLEQMLQATQSTLSASRRHIADLEMRM